MEDFKKIERTIITLKNKYGTPSLDSVPIDLEIFLSESIVKTRTICKDENVGVEYCSESKSSQKCKDEWKKRFCTCSCSITYHFSHKRITHLSN